MQMAPPVIGLGGSLLAMAMATDEAPALDPVATAVPLVPPGAIMFPGSMAVMLPLDES